jgi:type I restriction enzyme S subunit
MNWPLVPLGELLTRNEDRITLAADQTYREVTVRLWGNGVTLRRLATGAEIASDSRFVVRRGQFIASRIDARNGAFGLIPPELDGAVVTGDFPTFNVNAERLVPEFLGWYCRTSGFVDLAKAASEGTTNRVRLKEEKFLRTAIPLPPVGEQRRIVARVDAIASRATEARALQTGSAEDMDRLLMAVYRKITAGVPTRPMHEVAPLNRRPVVVDPNAEYPQLSARSFGRGTFHQPTLAGADITWEKPFQVKAGDILISNIKAWEGAIAVVDAGDDGRYSSHRYLTCVSVPSVATARFVCFHLLTPEGLHHVGEASPGSADRNRTTNSKQLMEIPVPVPPLASQLAFDTLHAKLEAVRAEQQATAAELEALLPSVLNRAFAGQL